MEAGSKFYVRVALANADSEGTRGSEDNTDENNYVSGDKGENEVKRFSSFSTTRMVVMWHFRKKKLQRQITIIAGT